MHLTRTTLRLKADLKRQAEKLAFEEEKSLQEIFNLALERYVTQKTERKAKRIVFGTHDLGAPLDGLTRNDMYETPSLK